MAERDLAEVKRDVKRGVLALDAAEEQYLRAEAFYQGDDPEVFLTDELRIVLRDAVAAFRLNIASVPVDVVADRLYISAFSSPDEKGVKLVEQVIADNELWSWSNDVMREAEKLGDYYVGVWAVVEEVENDETGEITEKFNVVLSPLDPISTRVIYDEELERIPEFAIRRWQIDRPTANGRTEKWTRITITYPDAIYKFAIKKGSGLNKLEPWTVDDEPWPLPNDADDLNIIHFRTGMPYGTPGHKKVYGVQQIITKTILNMMVNVDFMGLGQRYILKNPDKANQSLPAPAPRTKDGVAVTDTTKERPALRSGPGKVWELWAQAAGEFKATDAKEFLELLRWAPQAAAMASRFPQRYFSEPSGQQPSGESQAEGDKVLANYVSARKRSHSPAWGKLWKNVQLQIAPNADPYEINTEWMRDEKVTDKAWWDGVVVLAGLLVQARQDSGLREFMKHKLLEAGYSDAESEVFLSTEDPGETAGPVVDDRPGELDDPDVEGDDEA